MVKLLAKRGKDKKRIRRTNENIARVQLSILGDLFNGRDLSIGNLIKEYGYKDERTAKSDIAKLRSIGIPISLQHNIVSVTRLSENGLWKGTPIAKRLTSGVQPKQRLAREVVDFLKEYGDDIHSIILGTGTTTNEVAKELLARIEELNLRGVYTTNLLVLHEFILSKIKLGEEGIKIAMAPGILNVNTGSLLSHNGADYLNELPVDAVITSFSGLSCEGFSMNYFHDRSEGLMNLRPHKTCKYVIIPIEWSKIGIWDVVVKLNGKKRGDDVLDFRPDGRRYIIITDRPDESDMHMVKNNEKCKILDYWQEKGVETIYVKR